jgi:hypothetical protein
LESDLNLIPSSLLYSSHIVIISPICNEFPGLLLKSLPTYGFPIVALDVQGFTRRISSGGNVSQGDWLEKGEYLKYVSVLKIDNKEGLILMGTEDLRKASIECMKLGVDVCFFSTHILSFRSR